MASWRGPKTASPSRTGLLKGYLERTTPQTETIALWALGLDFFKDFLKPDIPEGVRKLAAAWCDRLILTAPTVDDQLHRIC